MRISFAAGAALLLVCSAAPAAEADNPAQPDTDATAVGIGVICNTTGQAEQFVQLRAGGAEAATAMDAVNRDAQDPRACGLAAVAFHRDKTLETRTVQGKLMSIVRISVVAGYDGGQWLRVPPMTQYAVMEADGVAI
jgi:hypothetical protein